MNKGKKGCGKLQKVTITSPIGPYIAKTCENGVHELHLDNSVTNENHLKLGSKVVQITEIIHDSQSASNLEQWMKNFFARNPEEIKIDICPSMFETGKFRPKVWQTLRENVPFGETISYGELAKLCGNPGACQAVGSAMSNNPISLIIPCHRVIKSNGSIGNYSKSTKNDIKSWLLIHESCDVA